MAGLSGSVAEARRESRGTYGAPPRVHKVLEAGGVACCEKTVAKLMRRDGFRAGCARGGLVPRTTDSAHGPRRPGQHPAGSPVRPRRADRVWVADITYIPTGQGWLYLAAVLDLGSRRVVGTPAADHLRSELAQRCAAPWRSAGPAPAWCTTATGGCSTPARAIAMLASRRIEASMSRAGLLRQRGDGGFFGTLKRELVHREAYATRESRAVAVRVHRGVLQSPAAALVARLRVARAVRRESETASSQRPLTVGKLSRCRGLTSVGAGIGFGRRGRSGGASSGPPQGPRPDTRSKNQTDPLPRRREGGRPRNLSPRN